LSLGTRALIELLNPVVMSLDCTLWGIKFFNHRNQRTLRIYIDKEKDNVNVDDCERVSRQCASILDVENIIAENYVLEVSSPGIDRPLMELNHYEQYLGSKVELKLRFPLHGRRNFKGLLKQVDGHEIVLAGPDEEYSFVFENIDKANLVPIF
tara:strand:- start:54 stop:512 length:459 start_codon:yes stop_codon:yes gene_type:complete